MAEKSSSSLRLDDFVAAVHADPANVEPTILLAGYLGRSSEEGSVRVYLDPNLGHWLEVPEAEVIHARPIADSPLGGSQLWVRASAQIKPGAAAAPAPTGGQEGNGDRAGIGADTGIFNPMATIHPTIWTQFCPTGIGCIATIPCLPPSLGCPPGGPGQGGPIGPTGWHTCACPATQLGCPNTISCPPAAAAAIPGPLTWAQCPTTACVQAVGPTGTQGCTQPGHCVGQTGWHTCACPIGPTGTQGCVGAEAVGYPGNPTASTRCFICPPLTLDPTSATRCFICPPIEAGGGFAAAAAQAAPLGPTGTQGCTQPGHCVGQTGWHTCACPIGPTGTQGCGLERAAWPTDPTASTRCFICPPLDTAAFAGGAQPGLLGPTGTQGCTQACWPQQSTAATLCTQVGCQPGGPVITLVTVSGCQHPSWVDACPTRLCMTVAGPCLPYTLGGCVPGARQF